jgi:hypothetical protein
VDYGKLCSSGVARKKSTEEVDIKCGVSGLEVDSVYRSSDGHHGSIDTLLIEVLAYVV